jgi:segregation and condensation protein B
MEDAPTPAEPQAAMSAEEAADRETAATVEAVLFATDSPISPAKIAQVAELPGRRDVKKAIETLNRRYEQMGCVFRIESIAGGYQILTLPEYHDVVSRLLRAHGEMRLSQAALEALAIIAYRQPILRADIEVIRGVACGEVLRGLMDKHLVKIVGRAEVLGRPMLYGTTRRFLEVFGLNDIKDLPKVEALRGGARQPPPAEGAGEQEPEAPAEEALLPEPPEEDDASEPQPPAQ